MAWTLVLGGARSGKSAYARREAEAAPRRGRLVMIATAEAHDSEMAERIARHRAERDAAWATLEAPRDLAGAVCGLAPDDVAVVDCLTLWLSNLMLDEADVGANLARLASALSASPARLLVVSNEVGQGIVPDNALARRFRDEAGFMHQRLAAAADRVVLVVAGLPLVLKG
ncbi:MAG: bifunctional adenosylcobinamide kinase/adenosylcobinamide-phosphate guanylyltransferase [Phenylobacterium sp.]|uniref:bifunctional adenosylcobinamide kinase/adenosylcobinamide-phosphate guanylyltransferase n=1 Tax=Phenylobacterium sp. TaxID=1871053 RepID=UPI00391B26DC